MKRLFETVVALDEETGEHYAFIKCLIDGQIANVADKNIKVVMGRVRKLIESKVKQIRLFPAPEVVPETSLIIKPNGAHKVRPLILPARG